MTSGHSDNSQTSLLWTLKDVTLSGDNSPRVDRVSAVIQTGVTAIIGYSGAGKSSLLSLLAGMEIPDSGDICGHFASDTQAGGQLPLYWVPQDAGLWPHMTTAEHVQAVSNASRTNTDSAVTDRLLTDLDLDHRRSAFPSELSRGEQSRLAVARCLAANARVMLMDEPLAHTDPPRRRGYWNVIRDFTAAAKSSLVFTTHEPAAAIREAGRVICLKQGRVLFDGPTLDLYRKPPSAETARFLGPVTELTAEQAKTWLGWHQNESAPLLLRPEMLEVIPDDNAPLVVRDFDFYGIYAETKVQDLQTQQQNTIVHHPIGRTMGIGQRVRLQLRNW